MALTQSRWQLVVTDFGDDPTLPRQQGVVRKWRELSGRVMMNAISTCSFVINHNDPLFAWMRNNDFLIKLYRVDTDGTRTLLFHGPGWTLDEEGGPAGVSMRVNCVDMMYRLHRCRTYGGFLAALSGGTYPRGQWAVGVIAEMRGNFATGLTGATRRTNAWGPGGIQPSPGVHSLGSNITINTADYETLWDVWVAICGGADGLDWKSVPMEAGVISQSSTPAAGVQTNHWGTSVPTLSNLMGTTATTAFRYGHGNRNVVDYKRMKSSDTMATEAWTRRSDGTIVTSSVTPTHGGGFSANVPTDDIANAATVTQLLAEHTTVRQNPREVYTLTPKKNGPRFRREFDLGDTFPFSAEIDGETLFDGTVRCYGVELEVGRGGEALTKPIVVDE